MAFNIKDFLAGILFLAIGSAFTLFTLSDLPLGTAFRMGPGYFPLLLSCLLIVLGGVNVLASFKNEPDDTPSQPLPWRGMFFILAAPLIFAFTVRSLGFAPAVFLVALSASLATRKMAVLNRAILVIAITVFCLIVFYWGLGLPVQLFSPRLVMP